MKPVAWMRRQGKRIIRITPEQIRQDDEPLYTAPNLDVATVRDVNGKIIAVTLIDDEHSVKDVLWQSPRELSDEEIGELFSKYGEKDKWFDFARAILKKASEK